MLSTGRKGPLFRPVMSMGVCYGPLAGAAFWYPAAYAAVFGARDRGEATALQDSKQNTVEICCVRGALCFFF